METTKYAKADRDAEGWCLFEDLQVEGEDYPYHDDRYTFSPEDFYRVHYACGHPTGSRIGDILNRIRAYWN